MARHKKARELIQKVRRILCLDRLHPLPRKCLVGILGGVFLAAGLIMTVTPGPAIIFVPVGLFLLASEFQWADRWAQRLMDAAHKVHVRWRARRRRRAAQAKA
jgi:hypothetical protein